VIWSALLACLFAVLALTSSAQASPTPPRAQHVVVVGLSGLRWSDVSEARTPTLWRLAGQGSVGNLVDYAVLPLTCPADGWLTLNAGARAQSGHTNAACGAFPAVRPAGAGASVPGLPALETTSAISTGSEEFSVEEFQVGFNRELWLILIIRKKRGESFRINVEN
jgi:hypothetical protein